MIVLIDPVIDYTVRALCLQPYPLHPNGCPNVGHCDRCPPTAPLYDEYFDLSYPTYAVINEFDFKSHVEKMKLKHPTWSERQLKCVLYWQGSARKQLNKEVEKWLKYPMCGGFESTKCPEGMGVDVTETLKRVGIELEWPVERIARQVVFLGVPLSNNKIMKDFF